MAKFVYITNGMASTLNSSFELSRRIVAAGHEVVYLSHLDLSVRVEAEGHRFIQLTSNDRIRREFAADWKTAGAKWSPRRFMAAITLGRHYRQRSLNGSEIKDAIGELQPDLLIIDIEMHYSIIALINSGIPIVLPIVWFSIFRKAVATSVAHGFDAGTKKGNPRGVAKTALAQTMDAFRQSLPLPTAQETDTTDWVRNESTSRLESTCHRAQSRLWQGNRLDAMASSALISPA